MKAAVFYSALSVLLITCQGYDPPFIYHKNFSPGTHPGLRFNGYYAEPFYAITEPAATEIVKPVYFYAEGSAFSANRAVSISQLNDSLQGWWGNYKILGDTILYERYQENRGTANYERVILKGIICTDTTGIRWVARKERNRAYEKIDYRMKFYPSAFKPDSTQNWTRKVKKWN
jgi:hypothetical protein